MSNVMLPYQAFEAVIEKYKITQQELANASGVDKGVISRFINGISDIKTSNLQKLVKALPPQAKAHYYMLFSYDEETKSKLKTTEKDNVSKV
jgi:transcriptional regulator with XRE-family HTH domain